MMLGLVTYHTCVCTRQLCESAPRRPDHPSIHLCLVLSLPSRLFLSGRRRCDSVFPISERIGTLGGEERKRERKGSKTEQDRAATAVLASVCSQLACGAAAGDERSLPDVTAETPTRRTGPYHEDKSPSQRDSLHRVMILIFMSKNLKQL